MAHAAAVAPASASTSASADNISVLAKRWSGHASAGSMPTSAASAAAAAMNPNQPLRLSPLWQNWKYPSRHAQQVMVTLFEMLEQRGYVFDPCYQELRRRVQQSSWVAQHWWRQHNVCLRARAGPHATDACPELDSRPQVIVLTPPSGSLNVDKARDYVKQYGEGYRVLVVVPLKLTVYALDVLDNKPWCEIWYEPQLVRNITRVKEIPLQVRVPDDEVEAILKSLLARKTQIPRILSLDPYRRHFHWPPGSVIRTERMWGGHSPVQVTYRIVVVSQMKTKK